MREELAMKMNSEFKIQNSEFKIQKISPRAQRDSPDASITPIEQKVQNSPPKLIGTLAHC